MPAISYPRDEEEESPPFMLGGYKKDKVGCIDSNHSWVSRGGLDKMVDILQSTFSNAFLKETFASWF